MEITEEVSQKILDHPPYGYPSLGWRREGPRHYVPWLVSSPACGCQGWHWIYHASVRLSLQFHGSLQGQLFCSSYGWSSPLRSPLSHLNHHLISNQWPMCVVLVGISPPFPPPLHRSSNPLVRTDLQLVSTMIWSQVRRALTVFHCSLTLHLDLGSDARIHLL